MITKTISTVFITFFLYTSVFAQSLSKSIDFLLKDTLFHDSDVSLAIYDLDADSMLYTYRENKLCRPASSLKLLTSVVALELLGRDYTIKTSLYEKKNISGGTNLYIKGEIDPLFNEDDLLDMLATIPKKISVDTLYADCTFMDSVYWGPGWSWDDTPWEFQPYISPLMLCGGCVEVSAIPSSKGEPPIVECTPKSAFYTIVNEAVSYVDSGSKFTILRDWLENCNTIRLRGDCNAPKSEKMNLYSSQNYFITVAKERLSEKEVDIKHCAFAETPTDATLLHQTEQPIADVIHEALMESNNLCAEALTYHLGALFGERPVHQKMGPEIIKAFLDYTIKAETEYNIADGSGLSLYNYLSAEMLIKVLRHAYHNSDIFDVIYKSLPVSGVSGTMKHRTKNSSAYKKIHAKTGTVKGVCTLAGYVQATNGHTLAFVIFNQNSMNSHAVRMWQDKVCTLLCK